MPTLSENFSPNFQYRRNLLTTAENQRSQGQRPIRRCLFGDVNEETRRKTDEWLENRLSEIKAENRRKSLKYGFDFENEQPMASEENVASPVEVDFEWTCCSADSMPSFYSRPPAARPEKLQRLPSVSENFKTPVKSKPTRPNIHSSPNLPIVQRKILTPARRSLSNSCATPLSNHSESTSVFVRPSSIPTQPDFGGGQILEPVPAGQSETTPHKPPESSDDGKISPTFSEPTSSSSSKSSMVIQRRRNIAQDDQSKMTNFFPLRKRCRRSTSQQRIKAIVGGVVNGQGEKAVAKLTSQTTVIDSSHHFRSLTGSTTS